MFQRDRGQLTSPLQHPNLRRQVEPVLLFRLFYCTFLVCTKEIAALTDFSGYLTKLLQNHTSYACDGDRLSLQCPRHSTISVQSAFYGQDYQMCNPQQPATMMKDHLTCMAPTALQKVLDECQNQRACQLLVHSRVFGPDFCPGTTKYLRVSFKCKPNCLSYSALDVLSKRCYGKQRCKIIVNNQHFGSPCLPGVRKYLTVGYACVPQNILTAVDPMVSNLNPSLKHKDGDYDINFDPSESKTLVKDGVIVSNSLATFAYIRAHSERAALLFVSSVCIGLIVTLFAVVIRVSCTKDFQKLKQRKKLLVPEIDKAEDDTEDEEEEDSSDSDFPDEMTGFFRTSYPVYSSTEAAEMAERIERRDQIIQEIWMNSGLDTSSPRNMDQYY
ncbi:protein eva-1 homolog C isoform X3 [Dromiciops gliroides]|uniref:protein eva-1 homolog C isoform X3 n=1 Tax=Dromiciops gliroides TaxID=33562 RepID=UPI001CC64C69|nr:protein eva-1 homolog C isoform X3 [Dromiciops gliroides]